MIRHAAAVAVVVCLSPIWLFAQSTGFTVNTAPADVHKGPSTGNPIIGQAAPGAVLAITRELGSWVRISWPAAQDGIGYIRVSMGRVGRTSTAASSVANHDGPPEEDSAGAVEQPAPGGPVSIPHLVGLGGRMGGSTLGFGGSARAAVAIALAFNSRCHVIR